MNYSEGIKKIQDLTLEFEATKKAGEKTRSFRAGNLLITYPGYKKPGDYRLSINGTAPTHTKIVREIYDVATEDNISEISNYLDDVYINGTNATNSFFSVEFTEKLFWITMQEDINYPMGSGRRLPFQRYFEAALAKIGKCTLIDVLNRTNNHGRERPVLIKHDPHPSFYE